MHSVGYATLRPEVCDNNGCWQRSALQEAGVTADLGAGWIYFLLERHFQSRACVGLTTRADVCDGLGVPLQENRAKIIFLELKTSGKFAKAIDQIRAGVEAMLQYDLPHGVALHAEIWHRRVPKCTIKGHRIIEVEGRTVFVRHRAST